MAAKPTIRLTTTNGEHHTLEPGVGPFAVGDYINLDDKLAFRVTGPACHNITRRFKFDVNALVEKIDPTEIPFELRYPFVTERDR